MNRRKFLTTTAASSVIARTSTARLYQRSENFELDEATVADLQDRMKQGSLTAERILALYLERIEAIDRNGPSLRSVIEVNPDAVAIARALDAERKSKGARGPLHGIPVLVKDNIETADK